MTFKKDFSCGGVALDRKDKKILMVKVQNLSGDVVWTFPKGHPEKGETDEDAAIREVREETGWDCKVLSALMDVHYKYKRQNILYDKTVRWFLMEPLEKVGSFQVDEIMDSQW